MNRQTIAARAAQNGRTGRNAGPVSTDVAARVLAVAPAVGAVRNRRAPKMTSVQRNGIGRRSEWRLSPWPRGGWR